MLQIGDTIISFDIIEKKFCCDLAKCLGACCVHGDSGAPLLSSEAEILQTIYYDIQPFMRREGVEAINKLGCHTIDKDGDIVTPLINNAECAYVIFEKGVALCAIEKAFEAGKINFKKPLSCHLYPIRVTKYATFEALNYHQWDICKPATDLGKKHGLPLYVFLKEPLIRAYGIDWYNQLQTAANHFLNTHENKPYI